MEREYRLVINEDDEVEIFQMDGTAPHYLDVCRLQDMIAESYEPRMYIYIADSCSYDRWEQFKIGVTNDPNRRERELSVVMDHWIPVPAKRAFKLEREIHAFLRAWRVDGEWFKFDDDLGKELKAEFQTLKNARGIVKFMNTHRRRVMAKNMSINWFSGDRK